MRGEGEERVFTSDIQLERIELRRLKLFIGRNAAASVNDPAKVSLLYVCRIVGLRALSVVVIEERNIRIVALYQAAARGVVMLGCQQKPCVVGQWINGLN